MLELSQEYRSRIQQLLDKIGMQACGMTEEEHKNIMGWCPISDDVVKELMKADGIKDMTIDAYISQMSDEDLLAVHQEVMKRYRLKRKKSAEKLLRENGRKDQADALAKEIAQEEKVVA